MAGFITGHDAVEAEIARLRDLDLPGLRARWRTMFRRTAPNHLPRHLLFRVLAYRLQAEQLGNLDKDTQRFLDRVGRKTPSWPSAGFEAQSAPRSYPTGPPAPAPVLEFCTKGEVNDPGP